MSRAPTQQTVPYLNLYHARKVADTASKPCFICYKATSTVLVTPCQKDFFYTCQSHLKDPGFATPKISVEELERKKQEEKEAALAKEKERIKKEVEEKLAKKKEKEKEKEKEKDRDGDKKDKGKEKDKSENSKAKSVSDDGTEVPAKDKSLEAPAKEEPEHRVFTLHKDIYKMRLTRTVQAANQRKLNEMLRTPGIFPEAPRGFG